MSELPTTRLQQHHDLYHELNVRRPRPINLINQLVGLETGINSASLYQTSLFSEWAGRRTEATTCAKLKHLYTSVTPKFSVLNVRLPIGVVYLRRFTPDGRFLIALNYSLTSLIVYEFRGASAGISYLQTIPPSIDRTDFNDPNAEQFRNIAFDTYFRERATIRLADGANNDWNGNGNRETLNRECLLFYKDTHLIVASSAIVPLTQRRRATPPADVLVSSESINFHLVETYTLYLIESSRARLCDTIKFDQEKITLANNQGLSLFKNTLTVLCLQSQTIHVYKLVDRVENGEKMVKFQLVNKIGQYCNFDEPTLLSNVHGLCKTFIHLNSLVNFYFVFIKVKSDRSNLQSPEPLDDQVDRTLTSMKQRILTFLYKQAVTSDTVSQFYSSVNTILKLRMFKMQLLDEKHLIIKYVNLDDMINQKTAPTVTVSTTTTRSGGIVTTTTTSSTSSANGAQSNATSSTIMNIVNIPLAVSSTSPLIIPNPVLNEIGLTSIPGILNENTVAFYFVIYDMQTSRIINVLSNSSNTLLDVYQKFQDYFTLTILDGVSEPSVLTSQFSFISSPANNYHAAQTMQRHVRNILRINSPHEMTKCVLSGVPVNAQAFYYSPYLDQSLFSYDEKLVSAKLVPHHTEHQAIRFSLRETGRIAFKIYTGLGNQFMLHSNTGSKKNVSYIWHPKQPFFISLRRGGSEFVVNFHVYSKN